MIGKSIIGGGFSGVFDYLLDELKGAEILKMNGVFGDSSKSLAWQMRDIASRNSHVQKPVWHTIMSYAPEDKVDKTMMIQAGEAMLKKLGFTDKNQFVMVTHKDHDHYQHVHIVSNRVNDEGKCLEDKFSKSFTVKCAKEIEKEFGLRQVYERVAGQTWSKGNSLEQNTPINQIKKAINLTLKENPVSWEAFIEIMQKKGIEIKKYTRNSGEVYGLDFRMGEAYYKSSQLGKGFKVNDIKNSISWNAHSEKINIIELPNPPKPEGLEIVLTREEIEAARGHFGEEKALYRMNVFVDEKKVSFTKAPDLGADYRIILTPERLIPLAFHGSVKLNFKKVEKQFTRDTCEEMRDIFVEATGSQSSRFSGSSRDLLLFRKEHLELKKREAEQAQQAKAEAEKQARIKEMLNKIPSVEEIKRGRDRRHDLPSF